ncbi:MAG: acyl-ACP--UDP-N-acetylglucosamine O-acyltransferase [Rubellimicrobium sp.]|nr:acyl-ACP--UDP-N-acetylglucosamine O-acyltransferase [Rubellimicrobium sp.]
MSLIDPSARIHALALVEEGARIGPDVRIGPFAHVGPRVVLHEGVELRSHAVVVGDTEIGPGTTIWQFAVLGEAPQDRKFGGELTKLRIGARNVIREHVTINPGTGMDGVTVIGDDCMILVGAHVAHDCRIGNRVTLVNNAGISGHCVIEDEVTVGGLAGLHQFVRVGRGAMIGALARVTRDVLPFCLVQPTDATLGGLNLVGLRRRGYARDDIAALGAAYAALRDGEGTFAERAARLAEANQNPLVAELVAFLQGESDRSFLIPA